MPIRVYSRSTILLLTMLITLAASDCPSLCECKWKNGKESVRCHNANLTEIPLRLDAGTQVLDLMRNEIIRLDNDEFSTVNLLNLQKIYLIDCQLTSLAPYAFRNLINLVELDLSENRLAAVPSHIFDSMVELRELRLSGNPVLRLDNMAFNGLTRLVRLELSKCRIRRIELRAFEGVRRSLEWLKLDSNELINVQPAALTILNNLHGIELTRNNWNCTCSLRPLREWMLQQNIPYEFSPVCAYPERLKERAWSRMDIDEFACPPVISGGGIGVGNGAVPTTATTTVTVKAIEGQNVTIGCGIVAGNPDPTIRWMFRNRLIVGNVSLRITTSGTVSATSGSSSSAAGAPENSGNGRSSVAAITTLDTRKKFYHHLSKTATNVTIAWIDSHDSGLYKCIAENSAGRSEATVSVLVYSRHYLIDSNNNVVEASVALSHSSNRFIFIISTIVAVLFVIFSLLLAICYYTVHRKNTRAAAAMTGAHQLNHQHHHHHHPGQHHQRKKVLNKKSFSFLLCQTRSESYEKIEMLAASNPLSGSSAVGGENGMATRAHDETTSKIYSTKLGGGDDYGVVDEDEDDMVSLTTRSFPKSSEAPKSVQDKRRTMSLNLSNSPTTTNVQRKKVAGKFSCRRNGGDYSNVPTTADEDSSGGGQYYHDKLMVTAETEAEEAVSNGAGTEWKLFTKHQAQADHDDNLLPSNRDIQQQWLNGQTKSFLPHHDEPGMAAAVGNVHQKVNIGAGNSARSNINLSTISGGNFSHPLADLCPVTTEPLINIGTSSTTLSTAMSGQSRDGTNLDLIQPSEVIRHHVMRKRILTASGEGGRGEEQNKSEGIVIYTTPTTRAAVSGSQSKTTADSRIMGDLHGEGDDFDEAGDKLGRLSPTLNSIIRNDENFDLFDVKSNFDDFYVKQLNYDYHQLQQQKQMLSGRNCGAPPGSTTGKMIPNQNYFCSLPRKKSYESSKKNLMGFSMGYSMSMHDGGCAELFEDLPGKEDIAAALFRQQQRQKSSSELNLMTSFEDATTNGLSFISSNSNSRPTDDGDDNGRNDGRHGTIIKPLSDNNKATPLLNFPTTSSSSAPTKVMAGTGSGNGMGLSTGIFPSNCGSPSIMMGSSCGPLASSILSPTNASAASSSSPASSSSAGKKSIANSSVKGVGGDYDYHAAQLEMFLDEYKRLQQQLCKMKETCDSIRRTEILYGNPPHSSTPGLRKPGMPLAAASISQVLSGGGGIGGDSIAGGSATSGYDQYYAMNKTLLEKSNVLLGNEPVKTLPQSWALSNKHKSYSGSTPEPPPYWLHRNELLKGIQQQKKSLQTGPQIFTTSGGNTTGDGRKSSNNINPEGDSTASSSASS